MRLALVPAGFLAGAVLCKLLLAHAPHGIATDLAQPLAVVTYWHVFGAKMWLALALAILIAAPGYFFALRNTPLRATVVISVLACAAALLFPVVFSSDVYAYAGYGDMALHGINPYAHATVTLREPVLDAMVWQWGNPPPMCVYGPAFVWLMRAVAAAFGPLGAAAPLWVLRILACGALVACAPLAYAAFAAFPHRTRRAVAAGIALNPVAIWIAAEGHNDTLALAIVLCGFAIAMRGRLFRGALLVALAALVKAPGAIAAVAYAAASWPDRARFTRVAGGALTGIAAAAALAIPLEYGVRAHLVASGHYAPQFSLQAVSLPLTVVAVAALLLSVRYVGVTRRNAALLVAFAAWLAIPNPYPWYAVWLLPVAFLAWESAGSWAILALSLLAIARYYPDATFPVLPGAASTGIVAIQLLLPLVLLIADTAYARRDRPENRTPAPDFVPRHSA